MHFNRFSVFGAVMVALMMIPNIIYAAKNKAVQKANNPVLNIFEQIGRFSCIIFMWLPAFVSEFSFVNEGRQAAYFAGNVILLIIYFALWAGYSESASERRSLLLAAVPTMIFLFSGMLLRHIALIAAAVIFGFSHIMLTALQFENNSDKS